MTLAILQRIFKKGFIILSIFSYGAIAYTLGKTAATDSTASVKGLATNQHEQVIEKPLPYADFQSAQIVPGSIKLCPNTEHGFEIGYPADWFTSYNTDDQKCTFFAPYSFVVPQVIDDNIAPITIELIKSEDWLNTLKFYENPTDFFNIISSQNIEINGRLVKKIEALSTGENSVLRGNIFLHYLIFDGEKPIRFSYTQLDENDDIKKSEEVLKTMVESLKYF